MSLRRTNTGPNGRNLPSMWLPTTQEYLLHLHAGPTKQVTLSPWMQKDEETHSKELKAMCKMQEKIGWSEQTQPGHRWTMRSTGGNMGFFVNTRGWKTKCHRTGVVLARAYSLDLFCGEIFRFRGGGGFFVCFSCAKTLTHTNTQIFISCEEKITLLFLAVSQVREHLIRNLFPFWLKNRECKVGGSPYFSHCFIEQRTNSESSKAAAFLYTWFFDSSHGENNYFRKENVKWGCSLWKFQQEGFPFSSRLCFAITRGIKKLPGNLRKTYGSQ